MTAKQKEREKIARLCDSFAPDGKSTFARQARAVNRRVDKGKGCSAPSPGSWRSLAAGYGREILVRPVTCDECPWRTDVPVGKFPPERYRKLINTSVGEDGFKPVFACHQSADGKEITCAGYCLRDGWSNLLLRMAAARGNFNPKDVKAAGPLYDDFRAMVIANGLHPDELPPKTEHGR